MEASAKCADERRLCHRFVSERAAGRLVTLGAIPHPLRRPAMTETFTFHADPLSAAVRAIVAAAGSHDGEAAQVAANLVQANLRGHDSHGVGMVPRYVDAVLEGGLAVNAHVAVRQDSGALLTLDGGQVYGQEAMELGAARAKELGVCIVGLAHSHHLGRIGQWAEQCVDHGLVSIHFVNVLSRPIVAPFGGCLLYTSPSP